MAKREGQHKTQQSSRPTWSTSSHHKCTLLTLDSKGKANHNNYHTMMRGERRCFLLGCLYCLYIVHSR
jgi:hypothetical protein